MPQFAQILYEVCGQTGLYDWAIPYGYGVRSRLSEGPGQLLSTRLGYNTRPSSDIQMKLKAGVGIYISPSICVFRYFSTVFKPFLHVNQP